MWFVGYSLRLVGFEPTDAQVLPMTALKPL